MITGCHFSCNPGRKILQGRKSRSLKPHSGSSHQGTGYPQGQIASCGEIATQSGEFMRNHPVFIILDRNGAKTAPIERNRYKFRGTRHTCDTRRKINSHPISHFDPADFRPSRPGGHDKELSILAIKQETGRLGMPMATQFTHRPWRRKRNRNYWLRVDSTYRINGGIYWPRINRIALHDLEAAPLQHRHPVLTDFIRHNSNSGTRGTEASRSNFPHRTDGDHHQAY